MDNLSDFIINDFSNAKIIDNFRLDDHGKLTKRNGYEIVCDFYGSVSSFLVDGDYKYVVSGSELYRINGQNAEYIDYLYLLDYNNYTGTPIMFSTDSYIYIIGNGYLFKYSKEKGNVSAAPLYAPLIIKDAAAESEGQVCEPYNLLTDHVKMSFTTSSSDLYYTLYGSVSAVHNIWLDDNLVDPAKYSLEILDGTCNIYLNRTLVAHNYNKLYVEYSIMNTPAGSLNDKILNASGSYIYNSDNFQQLILYGEKMGNKIYASMPTNYSTYDMFEYFPDTDAISIGDVDGTVKSFIEKYGKTFVFTDKSCYNVIFHPLIKENNMPALSATTTLISSYLGTGKKTSPVSYKDNIYVFNPLGLFALSYNPLKDEFDIKNIEVSKVSGIFKNVFPNVSLQLDSAHDELWCYEGNCIGVYNLKNLKWYCFTNMSVKNTFEADGGVYFMIHNNLCLFKDGNDLDGFDGFYAHYESNNYAFGNIFKSKTIYGFGISFDRTNGADIIYEIKNNNSGSFKAEISEDNITTSSPCVITSHARLSNCNYIYYSLRIQPESNAKVINEIGFSYRENDDMA